METGAKWKGWRVDQLIGEGSYGKVYKLVREEYGHVYNSALKVIPIPQSRAEELAVKEELDSEKSVRSYYQSMIRTITEEITLMSQLRGNSNIVSYEDHSVEERAGRFGWDICIRMELLTPLRQYRETRDLTVYDIVRMGIDICRGLETCEKYSIIHRDIKPANIFYSEQGFFKLGDFGIARQMERDAFEMSKKGTVSFMAPEVYRGDSYDLAADIYSLGLVLYQYLNRNRAPFLPPYPEEMHFSDREAANEQRLSGAMLPRPLFASAALTEILRKACAFSPADRYQSAADFRKALEQVLTDDMKQQVALPADREEENASDELVKTILDESVINTMDSTALPSKKKRRLSLILAVILALSLLGGALCFKQSYDRKGWEAAYEKVLKKNEDSIRTYEALDDAERPTDHSVALCDINDDGIPELLFFSTPLSADVDFMSDTTLSIYAYQNKSARRLFFEGIDVFIDIPDFEFGYSLSIENERIFLCQKREDNSLAAVLISSDAGSCVQLSLADKGRIKRSTRLGFVELIDSNKQEKTVFFQNGKPVSKDNYNNSFTKVVQNIKQTVFSPPDYSYNKNVPKIASEIMSQTVLRNSSMSVDETLNYLSKGKYNDMVRYAPVLNDYYSFINEYGHNSFDLKQTTKSISDGTYPYVSQRFAELLYEIRDGEDEKMVLAYALYDINNDGIQELFVRWQNDYHRSAAVYGLDRQKKPQLITDNLEIWVLQDGIVLGKELDENEYKNGGREYTIDHLSKDGVTLNPQDTLKRVAGEEIEGDYSGRLELSSFHGDEKVSEKEFNSLFSELVTGREKELVWTILRKLSPSRWHK